MFITKKKHDWMMAEAGRQIVNLQDRLHDARSQVATREAENQLLIKELADFRAKRERANANLAAANAARKAKAAQC